MVKSNFCGRNSPVLTDCIRLKGVKVVISAWDGHPMCRNLSGGRLTARLWQNDKPQGRGASPRPAGGACSAAFRQIVSCDGQKDSQLAVPKFSRASSFVRRVFGCCSLTPWKCDPSLSIIQIGFRHSCSFTPMSSSGVHISGQIYPYFAHTDLICGLTSALSKCLQFHVSR